MSSPKSPLRCSTESAVWRGGLLIADGWESRLGERRLESFEGLWASVGEAVDRPNRGRGGISEVTRLSLGDGPAAYLKRQMGYRRRGLRTPWGAPTLRFEVEALKLFESGGFAVPQVLAFGESGRGRRHRALLLLEALEGRRALPHYQHKLHEAGGDGLSRLLSALGEEIAQVHGAGLRHGSLYPKHLLLRGSPGSDASLDVAYIDLERGGRIGRGSRGRWADLDRLLRRSCWVGESEVEAFIAGYAAGGGGAPDQVRRKLAARRRSLDRKRRRRGLSPWDWRGGCRCPSSSLFEGARGG